MCFQRHREMTRQRQNTLSSRLTPTSNWWRSMFCDLYPAHRDEVLLLLSHFVWYSNENVSHILMMAQLLYLMCQGVCFRSESSNKCPSILERKFPLLPAMQFQQCTSLKVLCEQFNSLKWQQTSPGKNGESFCYFNKLNHPTVWSSKHQGWENGKGGSAQLATQSKISPFVS